MLNKLEDNNKSFSSTNVKQKIKGYELGFSKLSILLGYIELDNVGRIFYLQINFLYPTLRILTPKGNLKGFQIDLHFICAKMMIIRNSNM